MNTDSAMRIEGIVDLNPGSNDVDAQTWERARANPIVRLYLASGRLKEEAARTNADETTPDGAASRKRARA